jgi:hypothetical protein
MHNHTQAGRTHLFTVRLWLELLGEGCAEIRGEVRHVLSGRRRYVRDWPTLKAFLDECVVEGDSSWINPEPDEPGEAES